MCAPDQESWGHSEEMKNKNNQGDFSGGPGVKALPSNAGDMGSIPSWEPRSHMPQGN